MSPQTIAVDLTPVLPGGENGGAKVFVLELLRRLGELAPQTEFVLLTRACSHEELATLVAPNIRRLLVGADASAPAVRSYSRRAFTRAMRYLPARIRPLAGRLGHRLVTTLKRAEAGNLVRGLNADLLFCPFTAPTFHEPTVPTVSIIYDLQYKTYPQFFAAEDVAQRDRTFAETVRLSTELVAISDYARGAAIQHGKIDPERITTIHLHVGPHRLQTAERDETALERLALSTGTYLIYPANFWRHKNHEMLLTAFGIARSSGLADDVRLVCTGAPSERQRWLMQAARAMGLGEHVLFPGYLSTEQLLALIANSAGVVFPSLYEGFGLPVVEAMALGVPVACSNVTSLPEVAGDAAILFDPRKPDDVASAMIALTQESSLRNRLVEAGTARASRFSNSRRLAREFWDVFQRAVGTRAADDLVGVFPDRWVGPSLSIPLANSRQPRTLELEIVVPKAAPMPSVAMNWRVNKECENKQMLIRGQKTSMSIELPAAGFCEINLAPSFVPALLGYGEDGRELCAMLTKCEIAAEDGSTVDLLSRTAPLPA